MASRSLPAFIMMVSLVFMSASPLLGSAREFKVGGGLGWLEPATNNATLYNQWAGANRFRVGDSLVFEYNNDSVLVVEKWGYYHCDASKPIVAFNNGNSTVKLDRPGLFYFISGASDHCKRGLRMIVDVMSPRPPPSAALAPGSYFDGSPLPAQSSRSAPVSVSLGSLVMALAVFVATSV